MFLRMPSTGPVEAPQNPSLKLGRRGRRSAPLRPPKRSSFYPLACIYFAVLRQKTGLCIYQVRTLPLAIPQLEIILGWSFTVKYRLYSNSKSSCSRLPRVGTRGVHFAFLSPAFHVLFRYPCLSHPCPVRASTTTQQLPLRTGVGVWALSSLPAINSSFISDDSGLRMSDLLTSAEHFSHTPILLLDGTANSSALDFHPGIASCP